MIDLPEKQKQNQCVKAKKLYLYWTELFEIELFCHFNHVLMLKWTIWNRTVYMYKNGFGIK